MQLRKNQEVRIGNFNQGEAAGELFIYHHDKPYYKGTLDKKGNGKIELEYYGADDREFLIEKLKKL